MSVRKPTPYQTKVLSCFRLVDVERKRYACEVNDCPRDYLSGLKASNLAAHLRRAHSDLHKKIFGGKLITPVKQVSLAHRRLRYLQICTETVAVNGNAFTKLGESGYREANQDDLDLLQQCVYGSGLSGPHFSAIKTHIAHMRDEIQKQISLEVRGRFVAVMADSATKHDLSILGINIQYIYEGQLRIRSVAMRSLNVPQTAENLKNEIVECLQAYGIQKKQIISFTTDNANSMLAMVRLLNGVPTDDIDIVDDDEDIDSDINGESDPHLFQMDSLTNETTGSSGSNDESREIEANEILDEKEDFNRLLAELQQQFSVDSLNITSIRCAAHTIQLAVRDSLKDDSVGVHIRESREVCKLLRKKNIRCTLNAVDIKTTLPRMDCETRWNSTYRMVKNNFLEYERFVNDNNNSIDIENYLFSLLDSGHAEEF